jgi:hypothetical protein
MAEVLFISDVYIKKYTQVNDSVDPNFFYPSIYLSQDKYLQPYLGTNLYNKLKDDVANNTLTGDYKTLMDDYCLKVVLWWTMVDVYPYLTYKIDNGSLVQRVSEDTQPASDSVMKQMMDRAKQNAEYYQGLLIDYLCANSNLFPEYSNNTYPERNPIGIRKGDSNYIFSHGGHPANERYYGERRLDQLP